MSERKPEEQRISSVPPFGLRMLPDLRQRVEDAARENGRSMNAEIIARLEGSFEAAKGSSPTDLLSLKRVIAEADRVLESIKSKYNAVVDSIERKTDMIEEENKRLREELKRLTGSEES